jgi:hypothetical protein
MALEIGERDETHWVTFTSQTLDLPMQLDIDLTVPVVHVTSVSALSLYCSAKL